MRRTSAVLALLSLCTSASAQTLPGTAPLTDTRDLTMVMVESIHAYLDRLLPQAAAGRGAKWKRDTSSPGAYNESVEPNRRHLREMLGVRAAAAPPRLETLGYAQLRGLRVQPVRWQVEDGLWFEGTLVEPTSGARANVLLVPDCDAPTIDPNRLRDETAAATHLPYRLARSGCRVLVVNTADRSARVTSISPIRKTNIPHREFLWRALYQAGRTLIGLETQAVSAGLNWLESTGRGLPSGVFGHGEGGAVALAAGALDTRFGVTLVSGYFGPREGLWSEPIYRNAFRILTEFGDAEIASLILPRRLIVDTAAGPRVDGPPKIAGTGGGASGANPQFTAAQVRAEAERAQKLAAGLKGAEITLVEPADGQPFGPQTLAAAAAGLGIGRIAAAPRPAAATAEFRSDTQFHNLVAYTQKLMRESSAVRAAFWKQADFSSVGRFTATAEPYRERFWEDVIGKLPPGTADWNPRSRQIWESEKVTAYEITLDVYEGVFAYGYLLIPKGMAPGEKRPAVVCQHGLEGRPRDVADPRVSNPAYNQYAVRLAERGYVTFAPQNAYIGQDRFRTILRKAQPLGFTLFSFIVRQHETITEWLSRQPFVDPNRIAFYGLSYGGKSAMRIPAVIRRYCLSICSADFNEWIWKCMEAASPYSYQFTIEYDMPEWNLANTFNYAEMAWLISPRPFMVERGHDDGVAPDEWVAYEYARVRRHYVKQGLGDRTEIEFFNGPHSIHGVGTFAFLDRHLGWTARQ
jgi:cephalosporin-C deacetylase-like acetyl esterase